MQCFKSVSSVEKQAFGTHCVRVIVSVRDAMRISECGVECSGSGLEIAETDTGVRYQVVKYVCEDRIEVLGL